MQDVVLGKKYMYSVWHGQPFPAIVSRFFFIRPREDRNLKHGVILQAGEEAGEYHVREN